MDFLNQEPPVPYAPPGQQAQTPPPTQAPTFNPMEDPAFRAFVAQRAQQLRDLKAAQERATAERGSLGFRIGNALTMLGGGTEADLQGRFARAGQPVADVLQRQGLGAALTDEGAKQQALEATARQNQLAVMAQDPNSALSRRSQMLIAPIVGPQVASKLAHADIDLALKASREGGDLSKILAEAANTRATAGKTIAETGQVAPNAAVERGLKTAQTAEATAAAGKTGAEQKKIEMETGSQVAPGWVPTPGVQHTPEESKEFRAHWQAQEAINQGVDRITQLVGNKDFVVDPEVRAKVQPELAKLVFAVKEAAGIRGLPQADIQQIDKLFGDPTKVTAANLIGYSHNATRMQAFKDQSNRDFQAMGQSRGYQQIAGQTQPKAPVAATMKGSDGKPYTWNGKGWVPAGAQ